MPKDKSDLDGIARGLGKRLWATSRVATAAAHLAARRLMGARGAQDGIIGESLAHELDQMKGMAMKVGQILSYFEGILPAETHAALRRLQQGSRPVAFPVMLQVIERAFGQQLEALFDRFDRNPVASASIGQVYRAELRGAPVAVKVQYPGIRETMDGDFSRLGWIAKIASAATAVDGSALAAELRNRVGEECDYEREATYGNAFAAAFSADPAVSIPRAFPDRTRPTVLTTEWAEGESFYQLASRPDDARRNAAAMALVRFAYRSFFELATLNADPHPGNYLFPADGRVVFLDFGCVRAFDPAFVEAERRLARVVIEGRRADFRDAVVATGMVPRPDHFDFDIHFAMLSHQWEPYRPSSFRFTPGYLARGVEFSRPGNPNLRRIAIPPAWIWLQRLQWGLHAVLVRLSAEGDFRAALRPWLDGAARPLAPRPLRLASPEST
jgi:predicted unusual protein kinase regulating ubiquinone biosynthesis (AarF/ABC1/UbiB family)